MSFIIGFSKNYHRAAGATKNAKRLRVLSILALAYDHDVQNHTFHFIILLHLWPINSVVVLLK